MKYQEQVKEAEENLLNISDEETRREKKKWSVMEEELMEYVMIGTGMAVAIACILILEAVEYRRMRNEKR